MDRKTLIEKIKRITNEYDLILDKISDEELMHLYNSLEDMGYILDYSD